MVFHTAQITLAIGSKYFYLLSILVYLLLFTHNADETEMCHEEHLSREVEQLSSVIEQLFS